MKRLGLAAALTVVAAASEAASVSALDLAHCAAIAAPNARLACYDGLAGRAPDAAPVAAPVAAAAAAVPVAAVAAVKPAAQAADPKNFGLTAAQVNPLPTGPATIQAHIVSLSASGDQGVVVLDNGQTWSFAGAELDARLGPGEPVTIKRAMLGSYLMVTASRHAYHVHRTQ